MSRLGMCASLRPSLVALGALAIAVSCAAEAPRQELGEVTSVTLPPLPTPLPKPGLRVTQATVVWSNVDSPRRGDLVIAGSFDVGMGKDAEKAVVTVTTIRDGSMVEHQHAIIDHVNKSAGTFSLQLPRGGTVDYALPGYTVTVRLAYAGAGTIASKELSAERAAPSGHQDKGERREGKKDGRVRDHESNCGTAAAKGTPAEAHADAVPDSSITFNNGQPTDGCSAINANGKYDAGKSTQGHACMVTTMVLKARNTSSGQLIQSNCTYNNGAWSGVLGGVQAGTWATWAELTVINPNFDTGCTSSATAQVNVTVQ